MATWFDESRLDDEEVWQRADGRLRSLAESGARVRREAIEAAEALDLAVERAAELSRPRAVIAAGPDSRLLRVVLEPWCPVPFVAWPHPSLPGLGRRARPRRRARARRWPQLGVRRRRGRTPRLPAGRRLPAELDGRRARRRPVEHDPARPSAATSSPPPWWSSTTSSGSGSVRASTPSGSPRRSTRSPITCSPHRDLAVNPAKVLAIAMADTTPVVWGGSVLAARAARRIAESLRRASGRSVLAGDAEHLLPVLEAVAPRDVFDDPFADEPHELRPMLLVLDDGNEEPIVREDRGRLQAAAAERGVRIETLTTEAPTEVARYASLLLSGSYAAEYLRLGLVED